MTEMTLADSGLRSALKDLAVRVQLCPFWNLPDRQFQIHVGVLTLHSSAGALIQPLSKPRKCLRAVYVLWMHVWRWRYAWRLKNG